MSESSFATDYPRLHALGYTEDELDDDNPYTAWMREDTDESSPINPSDFDRAMNMLEDKDFWNDLDEDGEPMRTIVYDYPEGDPPPDCISALPSSDEHEYLSGGCIKLADPWFERAMAQPDTPPTWTHQLHS